MIPVTDFVFCSHRYHLYDLHLSVYLAVASIFFNCMYILNSCACFALFCISCLFFGMFYGFLYTLHFYVRFAFFCKSCILLYVLPFSVYLPVVCIFAVVCKLCSLLSILRILTVVSRFSPIPCNSLFK
jgi:hypothetical protein